jgi:hypothetical protein
MHIIVTKKHTFFEAKLELAIIIGTKVWPAGTPKHFEEVVIRWRLKHELNRGLHKK